MVCLGDDGGWGWVWGAGMSGKWDERKVGGEASVWLEEAALKYGDGKVTVLCSAKGRCY